MRTVLVILIASVALELHAETQIPLRIKPVCGNVENGIVVGKPRLFDERALALMIRSIEARLAKFPDASLEHAELTSKLLDLKALSDRALSDRVLLTPSKTGARGAARAIMLVEFQVSLDPQERYANSVAEVELTVSSRGELRQPAVLISQVPKEFTHKETETVALEKLTPTRETRVDCATGFSESARDLTLAWQFRPASGRDRIETGTHKLYALLALPTAASEDFPGDVHVHTSWRPLKKLKHRTALEFVEASSRDELWNEAIRFNQVEMELTLRPKVTATRFVQNGPNDLLIAVEGENFLADTTVMLGKTTISGESLGIERERHLQFTAPAEQLLKYDLFLAGTPLLDPRAQNQQFTADPAWGLKIEYARAHPKDAEQSEVRVKLKSRQRKRPLPEMIVNDTLVGVGGHVLTVLNLENEPTDSDGVLIRFDVPTADLRKSPRLTIARLFGGNLFRDSADVLLEDDISVSRVNVLAETSDEIMLGVAGNGFTNLAVVQIAGVSYTRWTKPGLLVSGSNMITIKVKRDLLLEAKQLTVSQGFAQPITVEIPELPERPRRRK